MKLLIGLGNPGEKYVRNRHNVGFMFCDFFLSRIAPDLPFKFDKFSKAEVAKTEQLVIIKPQTFMNRSGESVRKMMIDDKTIKPDALFVAHDDLDIPLGKFKIEKGHGPKLHNGLESIETCIGTKDFSRIRIGVDNRTPENRIPGEAYVLQNFTQEEETVLDQMFSQIYDRLSPIVAASFMTP